MIKLYEVIQYKKESLRYKIGSYHEKWLEEYKLKLFRQIDDEKRIKFFQVNKGKTNEKAIKRGSKHLLDFQSQ